MNFRIPVYGVLVKLRLTADPEPNLNAAEQL